MEKFWSWSRPTKVLENWRDLAAKHQIPHEYRYWQGYEDDLDVLVNALKKSDKNDKDRPHLCRAIWRRKRARRRHVDRQKKLECCEEGPALRGKPKSKHINRERSGTWRSRKLSLSSTAQSSSSQTRCRFGHCDKPRTKNENGGFDVWHTRVANTPVFQCDVEQLTKCIKKSRKHKSSHRRDFPLTQFHSA